VTERGWVFLSGIVGLPVAVTVGVAALRAAVGRSGLEPGSRRARALGCECTRVRNVWGLREALRGSAVVRVGCPVLAHHPDRMRDVYNGRG
jgi:hypothetical protein